MAEVDIKYRGNSIATMNASGTKTLGTQNKYCDSDIVVEYTQPAQAVIESNKNATPSETAQEITPSDGYDAMAKVTVGAVSSSYVGTAIPRKASANLSASGATVTAPAGYYENNATKTIESATWKSSSTVGVVPAISVDANGLITANAAGWTSCKPISASGYADADTSANLQIAGTKTLQLTAQAATTFHPSTTDQTIASGKYLTGAQTIKAVTTTNLTAANIKSGVVVEVGDSTDSDCVTSVTGTYEGGGGGGAYAWLGDGATKLDTKAITINLASDTSYDSWTASTTATTIKAASSSADYTLNGDFNSYDYCFVTKGFVQPVYVSGTPTTYRTHRVAQYYVTYYYGYPNSSTTAQVQTNTIGNVTSLSSSSNFTVQLYYNNGGSLVSRSATQCGPIYMSASPSFSTGTVSSGQATITYKLPAFYAKCDSSRFTTTRKGQVDSANTNYSVVLEVYRVAHGKGLMSYWATQMCNVLNA